MDLVPDVSTIPTSVELKVDVFGYNCGDEYFH